MHGNKASDHRPVFDHYRSSQLKRGAYRHNEADRPWVAQRTIQPLLARNQHSGKVADLVVQRCSPARGSSGVDQPKKLVQGGSFAKRRNRTR